MDREAEAVSSQQDDQQDQRAESDGSHSPFGDRLWELEPGGAIYAELDKKSHEYAKALPLKAETIPALAKDIKAHTQYDPIDLYDGLILDGRRRWAACRLAGVDPRTRTFDGTPEQALALVEARGTLGRQMTNAELKEAARKLIAFHSALAEARMKLGARAADLPENEKRSTPEAVSAALGGRLSPRTCERLQAEINRQRREQEAQQSDSCSGNGKTASRPVKLPPRKDETEEQHAKRMAKLHEKRWELIQNELLAFQEMPECLGTHLGDKELRDDGHVEAEFHAAMMPNETQIIVRHEVVSSKDRPIINKALDGGNQANSLLFDVEWFKVIHAALVQRESVTLSEAGQIAEKVQSKAEK